MDSEVVGAAAGRPFVRPATAVPADAGALGDAPVLIVVIDTEEEFDWSQPLARDNTAVTAIAEQGRAHEIFARYGVVATHVVDYPVARSDAAVGALEALVEAGRCTIGAHLHPWVNPPHAEAVHPFTSYPGNLAPALEREKLTVLTETITAAFGERPRVYRAGRFGIGAATPGILEDLGYRVDASVVAHTSFAADGGPDFRSFDASPFWFAADRALLEIPVTCGFSGWLAGTGSRLYRAADAPAARRLRAPGLLAHLRLLERTRLTPEGTPLAELERLTRSLLARGVRLFSLIYHSPSLLPGATPYVRDRKDLATFLATLEGYLDDFIRVLGGRPMTPMEVWERLRAAPQAEAPRSAATSRSTAST